LCCKTPLFFSSGPICVLLSSWRSPPGASYGIIGPTLVDRLRRTGDCCRWRRAAGELDEAPQVLSGCGQEHLSFSPAPASQSKSVELEDSLHVSKTHLDLFAFSA